MRTARLLIGTAAVVCAGILGVAAPAYGHNSLTGSDPSDGTTVERPPEQVELDFLARLDPDNAELTVTGPAGEPVDTGEPDFDGSEVTIPLPAGPAGEYQVDYRVLSSDGDWVDGTVRFTVATGTEPTAAPAASPTAVPATAAPASVDPAGSPPPPGTAPAAADREGSAGWWPWLLAGLLAVAAGALLAALRYRHRRRPTS